jgi:hypothetical protein
MIGSERKKAAREVGAEERGRLTREKKMGEAAVATSHWE